MAEIADEISQYFIVGVYILLEQIPSRLASNIQVLEKPISKILLAKYSIQ